jgi:hypothetical protein
MFEIDTKIDLKEIRSENVYWIHMALGRVRWQAPV